MLRYGGPEKYDQWVKHEIPFNDPVVVQAAQEFEKLALADGNVFGGRKAVVSNAFSTAANPMFSDPPKCFLHRQGNFITQKGFFPEKIRANLDEEVGVFQLPGDGRGQQAGPRRRRPRGRLQQRRGHQEGHGAHDQPRVQVRRPGRVELDLAAQDLRH